MLRGSVFVVPFAVKGLPLRVMRCLGPMGARFILLSTDEGNNARNSAYCDDFVLSPPQSDEEVLAQLQQMAPRLWDPILLPITTKGFEFVAEHRETLSARFRIPPVSSLESLLIASDKWKLYDFSFRHGLPVLPGGLLSEALMSEVSTGKSTIRFPALVKPSRKENGAGIKKVGSLDELRALCQQTPELEGDGALVQTFVDGDDFSLSVYCENGEIKAYTLWQAMVRSSVPYTIPYGIQFIEDAPVMEVGKKLLKLLNWQGVCDIDFLVDRRTREVWILEVNARFWANVTACLKSGVNFPLLMAQAANGKRFEKWPEQIKDSVFCYARGAVRGVRHPVVRRAFAQHPLRSTGLDVVARDPMPEFRRVREKLGRVLLRCVGRK